MIRHAHGSNRGFTLVELIVSLSLGLVVILAVFSTYLYLGRNLTQLSYRNALESQSRKILTTFASDIRNTKSVTSAAATNLALTIYNQDATLGSVPTMAVTYDFSTSGANPNKLTRNGVPLVKDAQDTSISVMIAMLLPTNGKLFSYSTTTGNTYTTAGTGPTYQATNTLVPISIKQVAINFSLQAGDPLIQGAQGTLSTYPVASGQMPLINRQLLDGN